MSTKLTVKDIFKVDGSGVPYLKLVIYGPSLAGKTSMLTVYNVLRKVEDPETIYSSLKKIDDPSGRTIFYDQSTFELPKGQGVSVPKLRYQVWTVAGQKRHYIQRKVVLEGADGLIFMFDPSKNMWEDNVESLDELLSLKRDVLGKSLPFLIVLNKIDLPAEERTPTDKFLDLLIERGLATNKGEAYMRVIETSCLQARNDLMNLLRSPDIKSMLDEYGRLKKGARPLSVQKVAQPIEQLTRDIVVHRVKTAKNKA
ncbi:MAG: ADP-ribosylation factor-like protein [Candidatus Heimdallarchaeaceae archaeon]